MKLVESNTNCFRVLDRIRKNESESKSKETR